MQHTVVALESVNHLLQLRVADHQALCSLVVLLQRKTEVKEDDRNKRDKRKEEEGRKHKCLKDKANCGVTTEGLKMNSSVIKKYNFVSMTHS